MIEDNKVVHDIMNHYNIIVVVSKLRQCDATYRFYYKSPNESYEIY